MTSATSCNQCGNPLAPGSERCDACGAPVPGAAAGPAPPEDAPAPDAGAAAPPEDAPAPVPGSAASGASRPPPASAWDVIQERLSRAAAPRYRVIRLLGYGGMAGVYLSEEPRLGRKVVIKVLSPALVVDASLVERFQQEARTVAQLSHPGIVSVFDVDERDGLHYFAMNYVPGRTLAQVMAEAAAALPVAVVRAWLHQVGDALSYAHRAGVIHRDVKPGNILLDAEGNAMVSDFGIAKVSDQPGLTQTGLVVGTPAYMSPEQCMSWKLTGASDQYSLGIVAYQLLTGRAPFSGPTMAVLQAHLHERPRPIPELRPDCPPELWQAIDRMLAKRPEERWPDVNAAVAATGGGIPGVNDPVRAEMRRLATPSVGIALQEPPSLVREGEARPIRALVTDPSGQPLHDRRVAWQSADPHVARVDADATAGGGGTLAALRPGRVRITAICGEAVAGFDVGVEPDPVGTLQLDRDSIALDQGGSATLSPTVTATDGRVLPDRALLWLSSDPEVAAVSPDGVITGVGTGSAVVTAMTGERTASLAVTVSAASVARRPAPHTVAVPGDAARTGPESLAATGAASRPPSRRPVLLGLAAIVALVVVAAVVYLPGRGGPADAADGQAGAGADAAGDAVTMPVGPAAAGTSAEGTGEAGGDVSGASDTGAAVVADAGGSDPAGAAGGQDAGSRPAVEQGARTGAAAGPEDVASRRTTGTVLIQGRLPAGADVAFTDRSGRVTPLRGDSVVLDPGDYRYRVRAPGHEPANGTLSVAAGERMAWAPSLRPLAPAPEPARQPQQQAEQPPQAARQPSAADRDAAAIRGAVSRFIEDLAARRAEPVLPLFQPDARAGWQYLLTDRSVTNWSVVAGSIGTPRLQEDRAGVDFNFEISYRSAGRTDRRTLRFRGELERTAPGEWRLVSVTAQD